MSGSTESAVGLAIRAHRTEPILRRHTADDPAVRIVVLNAARSTTKCRRGERFEYVVQERETVPLIKQFETPWTICDLEDVVQQRRDRRAWPELEGCRLRSRRGIYGQPRDDLHFRSDVAVEAGDELLKAVRRTALSWYGHEQLNNSILLVLAAGWNTNTSCFSVLDSKGHAWRKAELVATAELCALNGHPFSYVMAKFQDLVKRSAGNHSAFILQNAASITAIQPPPPLSGQKRVIRRRWQSSTVRNGNEPYESDGTGLNDTGGSGIAGDLGAINGSTGGGVLFLPPAMREPSEQEAAVAKRRREIAFLAEARHVSSEAATALLNEAGGNVSAAMDLPKFRAIATTPVSLIPFAGCLVGGTGILEISDGEDDACPSAHELGGSRFDSRDANHDLAQLVRMGFDQDTARTALRKCGGRVEEAVELLIR